MSSTTRLLIVRHGHVEGIDPERFRGRTDVDLTAAGVCEAEAAAKCIARLWEPVAIYTSPLRRCIVTGAAISRATAAGAKVLESLVDINYGSWQWKTPDEVRVRWPRLLELWYRQPERVRVPAGESLWEVAARTAEALRFVQETHVGQTVVLVTHDTVVRTMLLQLLEMPLSSYRRFAVDPCGISEATVVEGAVCLQRVNWRPLA